MRDVLSGRQAASSRTCGGIVSQQRPRRGRVCLCIRPKGCCKGKLCYSLKPIGLPGSGERGSKIETAFLGGGLCSEPSILGAGDLDDSVERVLEGRLHLLRAEEEEADWRHRAGMPADLAPTKGQTKGGRGRWPETGGGRVGP